MFSSISWSQYLSSITIVLILYYLYIIARYFRADMVRLLSGKRQPQYIAASPGKQQSIVAVEEENQQTGSFEKTPDDEFAEIEHLIERLKPVIADASGRKLIPQEFKQYLSLLLREYPGVRYSPLRSSINELIISECQKYGVVTLNEAEAELLWQEVV